MDTIPFFDDKYPVRTIYTNLSDYQKIDPGHEEPYLPLIEEYLNLSVTRMIVARERHSGNILLVDHEGSDGRLVYIDETYTLRKPGGYDSMITSIPGILLAITTADCTPVYLYDTKNHVIAIVHSGWRGTVSAITVNTIRTMEKYYGTDPHHTIAAFGPCNCGRCYEVGEEFPDLLKNHYTTGQMKKILRPAVSKQEKKYYLDVKEAIRTDLISKAGVKEEHIYDTGICSYESELFPSYRRDGKMELNRQTLSGIMLL